MAESPSPTTATRIQHPRRSSSLEAFHPGIVRSNERERNLLETLRQDVAPRAADLATSLARSEILTASMDLKALETLNGLARDRYVEYGDLAIEMVRDVEKLQASYDAMEPYLHQVTELERQVASMEAIADELDDYTKRLEATVKRRISAASRS
ncbi:biogenesis of lysosome- organelles complex 1 subunit 2 [Dinochytrium kinnereticum]|nr:biogenesis of lysosome- organelles complex 1 subunit 2 [Dinochytrium kinnereticum]